MLFTFQLLSMLRNFKAITGIVIFLFLWGWCTFLIFPTEFKFPLSFPLTMEAFVSWSVSVHSPDLDCGANSSCTTCSRWILDKLFPLSVPRFLICEVRIRPATSGGFCEERLAHAQCCASICHRYHES